MFCYQCEQTLKGTGCIIKGVCAKTPESAALQDLLVYGARGVAHLVRLGAAKGKEKASIAGILRDALFATVTNVNFDDDALTARLKTLIDCRDALKAKLGKTDYPHSVSFALGKTLAENVALAEEIGIRERQSRFGFDVVGLQELMTYGLKGMAAYAHHAALLGYFDDAVDDFLFEGLDALNDPAPSVDGLFGLNMRCGEASVKVLALLDAANTGVFGHPEPTPVRMGAIKGKAILVSGHDLSDLKELLEQTKDKGINIYTHGEMLPAHAYPGLKKYPHLVGHFGGAWMKQREEFQDFPGAIVMTTNCLMQPEPSYQDRLFTRGLVGWSGIAHLDDTDFSSAIKAALEAPGFTEDDPNTRTHMAGFAHNTVLGAAEHIIGAVKGGQIKRFMLVGGCDGAKPGRNYFTEIAEQAPNDWAILTLGCGKFRLTDLDLGEIAGLPRLLDMGQCNDSYSAVRVALALAEAFETDVNSLPLSLVVSWYEQKAVTVLLALLSLGVQNIRLGPSLPAFVTPAMLSVLIDKFAIKLAGPDIKADLAAMERGDKAA